MDYVAIDIELGTKENSYFRHVIFTTEGSQLVFMNLRPGESIGEEIHDDTDQFLRFEFGTGKAMIEREEYPVFPGTAFLISRGTLHNFINTGNTELKLYTIYSPPHHPDGLIQVEKPN